MRIDTEHGLWIVAEPTCHHMQRYAFGERDGRVCVAEDVQGADRDACRLSMAGEPFRQARRMDRTADLVAEHEVVIVVCGACEVAFKDLSLAMAAKRLDRLRI
jgi:hypothetical protein